MRELPFTCSADALVCALLSGKKTQDRRAVKWRGISPGLNQILFRYEAPALADAANGALRRDAEH